MRREPQRWVAAALGLLALVPALALVLVPRGLDPGRRPPPELAAPPAFEPAAGPSALEAQIAALEAHAADLRRTTEHEARAGRAGPTRRLVARSALQARRLRAWLAAREEGARLGHAASDALAALRRGAASAGGARRAAAAGAPLQAARAPVPDAAFSHWRPPARLGWGVRAGDPPPTEAGAAPRTEAPHAVQLARCASELERALALDPLAAEVPRWRYELLEARVELQREAARLTLDQGAARARGASPTAPGAAEQPRAGRGTASAAPTPRARGEPGLAQLRLRLLATLWDQIDSAEGLELAHAVDALGEAGASLAVLALSARALGGRLALAEAALPAVAAQGPSERLAVGLRLYAEARRARDRAYARAARVEQGWLEAREGVDWPPLATLEAAHAELRPTRLAEERAGLELRLAATLASEADD